MNHSTTRRLESGGWHFTTKSNGVVVPIGYCSEHEGHATEQEARECYKRYVLDHRLSLDPRLDATSQHKCKVCGAWTTGMALVDEHAMFSLCDEHRTREHVAELYEAPSEIWST